MLSTDGAVCACCCAGTDCCWEFSVVWFSGSADASIFCDEAVDCDIGGILWCCCSGGMAVEEIGIGFVAIPSTPFDVGFVDIAPIEGGTTGAVVSLGFSGVRGRGCTVGGIGTDCCWGGLYGVWDLCSAIRLNGIAVWFKFAGLEGLPVNEGFIGIVFGGEAGTGGGTLGGTTLDEGTPGGGSFTGEALIALISGYLKAIYFRLTYI